MTSCQFSKEYRQSCYSFSSFYPCVGCPGTNNKVHGGQSFTVKTEPFAYGTLDIVSAIGPFGNLFGYHQAQAGMAQIVGAG